MLVLILCTLSVSLSCTKSTHFLSPAPQLSLLPFRPTLLLFPSLTARSSFPRLAPSSSQMLLPQDIHSSLNSIVPSVSQFVLSSSRLLLPQVSDSFLKLHSWPFRKSIESFLKSIYLSLSESSLSTVDCAFLSLHGRYFSRSCLDMTFPSIFATNKVITRPIVASSLQCWSFPGGVRSSSTL